MNKVYKVIWCKATQTYQAVSEVAKGQGKSSTKSILPTRQISRSPSLCKTPLAIALSTVLTLGFSSHAFATDEVINDVSTINWKTNAKGWTAFDPATECKGNLKKQTLSEADKRILIDKCAKVEGDRVRAFGDITMGVGAKPNTNTDTHGKGSILIGTKAENKGTENVVVGSFAKTIGTNSIALGDKATTGDSSISPNDRKNNQQIAIGSVSLAKGDQSIALGANTKALGHSSISIGGDDLDAVAHTRKNPNVNDIPFGGSFAPGFFNNSDVAKKYEKLTGQWLVGETGENKDKNVDLSNRYPTTQSKGQASVAIGVQSVAKGDISTAVGTHSYADGFGSVAFGVGAVATSENSVALGAGSQTDITNSYSEITLISSFPPLILTDFLLITE